MTDRRKLKWLAVAFALLTAALIHSGRPLMTGAAPLGIVSFQLAFSETQAHAILRSWDGHARAAAWLNLLLDFPYLVVYAWILSLLCRAAASGSAHAMSRIGAALARITWLAAVFDSIENFALLRQLAGVASHAAALFAGIAACAKFFIIAIALAYLLTAAATIVLRR